MYLLGKFTLIDIILVILLIVCSYTDIKYRKVLNIVSFPAIFLGISLNTAFCGIPGFINSILGLFSGLAFLFIFFLLGGIGAGDLKFMTAVGSLMGWKFVLIGGLYGAVIAGIIAIFILIIKRDLFKPLKKLYQFLYILFISKTVIPIDRESSVLLPYSFLLSTGMFLYFLEQLYVK